MTHKKPSAVTFDADLFRVSVRVLNEERPTGLAAVAYRQRGYDITVKVVGPSRTETFERIGSLLWRDSGNCAWSLGSVEGLWRVANTLNASLHGSAWSYRTDQLAFDALCAYIKRSLETGPFTLRRER